MLEVESQALDRRGCINEKYKDQNIDIDGNAYKNVHTRIEMFYETFPTGGIRTEIISKEWLSGKNGSVLFIIMKANCIDDKGSIIGTGHAQKYSSSNEFTSGATIECCETAAIGRAIASCGLGISNGIASVDEVDKAKVDQQTMRGQVFVTPGMVPPQ